MWHYCRLKASSSAFLFLFFFAASVSVCTSLTMNLVSCANCCRPRTRHWRKWRISNSCTFKTALFSVFTGTLLLRHMAPAGGLFSQFNSDILLLNVPPSRWTDSNGPIEERRAQTFQCYFFFNFVCTRAYCALTYLCASLMLLLCSVCDRLTQYQRCNRNTWRWLG